MGLNEAQRRSVTVTLEQLEQHLAQIDRLLFHPDDGRMERSTLDLSPEHQEQLRHLVAATRAQVVAIADAYTLPTREISIRQHLAGILAVSWSDLEDVRPAKLSRYGPVDPALVEAFDAAVDEVISGVLAMLRLCQTPRTE